MTKTYNIKYTKYTKIPTGAVDKYGNKVYQTVKKDSGVVKNTNWSNLKSDAYKKAKSRKDTFANYEDRFSVRKSRVLKSVTKRFSDGKREITYFG